MDEQVNRLVAKLEEKLTSYPRYLVAIAGIPGSGKTTVASTVTARLNAIHPGIASLIPLDGYHLSRAQLSALPNAAHAHARRGAAFTFDSASFLSLLQAIRAQTAAATPLYAPSFDHAVKDPVADDIEIRVDSRVLIFEGLYLALNEGVWKQAGDAMNEVWWVECGFDTAEERLVERHVRTGVTASRVEARERARGSDALNRDEIVAKRRGTIHEVVVSVEDGELGTRR